MSQNEKILILGSSGYVGSSITYKLNKFYKTIHSNRNENANKSSIQLNDCFCEPLEKDITLSVFAIGSTELQSNSFVESVKSSINTLSNFLDRHSKDIPNSPIIYISTFQVYGKYTGSISEESHPSPKNIYALVHLLAEDMISFYAKSNNVRYCILRPSNIFGTITNRFPFRRETLVPNCFIKEAIEKNTITIKAKNKIFRDFININYLVDVTVSVIKDLINSKEIPTIINVSKGNVLEIFDIANDVAKLTSNYLSKHVQILKPNIIKTSNIVNSPLLQVRSNYILDNCNNGIIPEIEKLIKLYLKEVNPKNGRNY